MIKLRLKRYGRKRQPSYRIVAANSRARRDGRPIEELGFYNPRTDETTLNVPAIVRHLQQGAQPTDTVRHILKRARVFDQIGADGTYKPLPVEETVAVSVKVAEPSGQTESKEESIAPPSEEASVPETAESEPAEPSAEVDEVPAIAETPNEADEGDRTPASAEDESLQDSSESEEPVESEETSAIAEVPGEADASDEAAEGESSQEPPADSSESSEPVERSDNSVSAENDASIQEG